MNLIMSNSIFLPCVSTCGFEAFLIGLHALSRLIAKYRPTMPVLSVVIPRLKTNQLKWSFTGAFEVRSFVLFASYSLLGVRGGSDGHPLVLFTVWIILLI